MAFKFVLMCGFVAFANAGLLPAAQIAEVHSPAQYDFSYSVHDAHTGDIKAQQETRHGDTVQGQYSLVEPDGHRRIVTYAADPHNGFNAVVQREGTVHQQQQVIAKQIIQPAIVQQKIAVAQPQIAIAHQPTIALAGHQLGHSQIGLSHPQLTLATPKLALGHQSALGLAVPQLGLAQQQISINHGIGPQLAVASHGSPLAIGGHGLGLNGLAINGIHGVGLNNIGLNGVGLNGYGLNGVGLNGYGLSGNGLHGVGLNSIGLNGNGLHGIGLNSIGLNGVGLNGIGLNGLNVATSHQALGLGLGLH